jgi:hypothetical protein
MESTNFIPGFAIYKKEEIALFGKREREWIER